MFFSFKEVETIKGVKLSLALLFGLVFLFACVPNALGCYMDVKPGSYPNSINVHKNGVVTIALEDAQDEGQYIDSSSKIGIYLQDIEEGDPVPDYYNDFIEVTPERCEYTTSDLCPYPGTDTYYAQNVYLVKLNTQTLSGIFDGHSGDNLYLWIRYGGVIYKDSVRLIDNN